MLPAVWVLVVLNAQVSEAPPSPEGAVAPPESPVTADAPGGAAVDAPASPSSTTAAVDPRTSTLNAAVMSLVDRGVGIARVAVTPIRDDDAARATRLSALLAAAIQDEGLEAVTPEEVRRVLGEAEAQALADLDPTPFRALSSDHVLLGEVVPQGGAPVLELRLVHVESGAVVGVASVDVEGAMARATATRATVKGGVEKLVDEIAIAMDALPGEARYQRLAIMPLDAAGAAVEQARLPRFVEAELARALVTRGYLVVERQRLDAAIAEAALGATFEEENAPKIGAALDAQALLVGSVGETGDTFTVSLRVIGVDRGQVLGTASTTLPREGAVSLASDALETRTPMESLFRSAVAPGWGQFYNREPVKGTIFGVVVYTAAVATLATGVATVATFLAYQTAIPTDDGAVTGESIKQLRLTTQALLWTVLGLGAITTTTWGMNVADAFFVAAIE